MSAELARPHPVKDIRAYLETPAVQEQMAKVLPSHLTSERVACEAARHFTEDDPAQLLDEMNDFLNSQADPCQAAKEADLAA